MDYKNVDEIFFLVTLDEWSESRDVHWANCWERLLQWPMNKQADMIHFASLSNLNEMILNNYVDEIRCNQD